jgi:dipeptidyl aminopeptidase/acylaminoacyl peptidase
MKLTRRKVELIILGILIVALIVYVRHFEKTQIYFPERAVAMTPSQYGLKFDDVTLVTKDNVRINTWYIPADKPVATFLFCHGNAGNNVDRLVSIEQFHRMNINVFIFDYRGYGKSEGSPSEQGTYKDAIAAYSYLTSRKDVDSKKIFCYGDRKSVV